MSGVGSGAHRRLPRLGDLVCGADGGATTGVGASRALADSLSAETILAFVLTASLWALCHPYRGIVGDANVYVGRVLADLDPAGVGRDMMFVDDGQSKFSLFPLLARPIVRMLGVSQAATLIAAAGSACWFLALVALAHVLASGRAAWAIVIAVSVLPASYGNPGVFSFAETSALPRPFAEAAVLGASAAIARNRAAAATALLALGMVLHPIMALPGVAVAAVLVLWRMSTFSRTVALGMLGVGGASAVALGWLGWPLVDRLVTRVDPEWMGMMLVRSPHLFPTLWAADAFSPLLAQATTLVVAARCAPAPTRRLLLAVLVTATAGLAVSAFAADEARLLFFVQVQSWRATWLLAVFGGCALGFCAPRLWARGASGRLVLSMLVLAWFVQAGLVFAMVVATAALVLDSGRLDRAVSPRLAFYALATTCGLAVFEASGVVLGYVASLATYPGALPHLVDPLRNNIQTLPILIPTAIWLLAPPLTPPLARAALGLAALVLTVATIELWLQRPASLAYFETRQTSAVFASLAADRPQEVYWIDSRGEPWMMLGRPQYLSPQQAVSIVFSRKLAVQWYDRARLLVDLGLAERMIFTPWRPPAETDRVHVTQAALDTLCRRPDAPGLVVLPIEADRAPPPLHDMRMWPLPDAHYAFDRHPSVMDWVRISSLGIVPCHPPVSRPGASAASSRPAARTDAARPSAPGLAASMP